MRCTPMASEMVTTAGSASGTTATARAMPKMSISMNGCPRSRPSGHDDRHDHQRGARQHPADLVEVLLQRRPARLDVLEHLGDLAELGLHARWPRRRRGRGRRSRRSRRRPCSCGRPAPARRPAIGSVCFSTGTDSPVSAASSICRLTASTSRASAGTRSPARRRITSPGTSSRAGISISSPSRSTVAVGAAISRSASMARSARYSCTKPSSTANSTITAMAMASTPWPRNADRATATSRMTIRTFLNCSSSSAQGETRRAPWSSFGPCSAQPPFGLRAGQAAAGRAQAIEARVDWQGVPGGGRFGRPDPW